jgi:hypothetical protein
MFSWAFVRATADEQDIRFWQVIAKLRRNIASQSFVILHEQIVKRIEENKHPACVV